MSKKIDKKITKLERQIETKKSQIEQLKRLKEQQKNVPLTSRKYKNLEDKIIELRKKTKVRKPKTVKMDYIKGIGNIDITEWKKAEKSYKKKARHLPESSPGYKKAIQREIEKRRIKKVKYGTKKGGLEYEKSLRFEKVLTNKKDRDKKYIWIVEAQFRLGPTSKGSYLFPPPDYFTIIDKKKFKDDEIKNQTYEAFGLNMEEMKYKKNTEQLYSITIIRKGKFEYDGESKS